jgi:hypothetical protein
VVAVTPRVLLVGKRARVLDRLADALRQEGMHVREDTDFDHARTHVDGSTVDVIALGRAVPGGRREPLVSALKAQNPALKVVDGLAPITPLLVAQVKEALTDPGPDSRLVTAAGLLPGDDRVVITLRRPATVSIILHRLDTLYRAHEQRIHDGPLGRGRHTFLTRSRSTRGERFLVVRANDQTSVHAIG